MHLVVNSDEKMLKADIDELKYLFTDITDPTGEYSHLSSSQKASVNKTIVEAVIALQRTQHTRVRLMIATVV